MHRPVNAVHHERLARVIIRKITANYEERSRERLQINDWIYNYVLYGRSVEGLRRSVVHGVTITTMYVRRPKGGPNKCCRKGKNKKREKLD